MDIVQYLNILKDIPTDKMVILFLLVGVTSGGWKLLKDNSDVVKNNTSSMNTLNTTLQVIISNQSLHDERNKSDFKSVKNDICNVRTDVSNVRVDVTRVERDVAAVQDNVNDISRTVSIIQGQITK